MTHRRIAFALEALAVLLLSACGDIEVRSVPADTQPTELLSGIWSGGWESDNSADSGTLEVRIQDFDGEPVVSIVIDNPCLQPQDYDLTIAGNVIRLEEDGVAVLEASLVGPDQLVGSYTCALDSGSWGAARIATLPEPIDLSGAWQGRIYVPGVASQDLNLRLLQSVQAGQLVLDGSVELPGVLPFPIPVEGLVVFQDQEFLVTMQTSPGFLPILRLGAIGTREPLQIPVGTVQVLSPSQLPFEEALLELQPR